MKCIHRFCFIVVVSIHAADLAQKTDDGTWTKASGPMLEGRVALEPGRSWHIGGFCFGHTADETDREVGLIEYKVGLYSSEPLDKGVLFLAAWDDTEHVWGDAKRRWHSSSCEDKLSRTALKTDLHQLKPALDNKQASTARAAVLQHIATKDIHYGLVSCENLTVGANAIFYELHAVQGALSVFDANHLDAKSCPILPSEWLQEATAHSSFWILLFGCACISAVPCCAVSACLLLRAKAVAKKGQELPVPNVVGRPVSGIEDEKVLDSRAQVLSRGVPPYDDKSPAPPEKVLVSPESAGVSPHCKV